MSGAIVDHTMDAFGLVKHCGEVKALDGLDPFVEKGHVLGLLDPKIVCFPHIGISAIQTCHRIQ